MLPSGQLTALYAFKTLPLYTYLPSPKVCVPIGSRLDIHGSRRNAAAADTVRHLAMVYGKLSLFVLKSAQYTLKQQTSVKKYTGDK